MALDAALGIPIRLAMAEEIDQRHETVTMYARSDRTAPRLAPKQNRLSWKRCRMISVTPDEA
jgi:hypothetical protein